MGARGLQAPAVPAGIGRALLGVAAVALLCLLALGVAVAGTSTPFPVDDALLDAAGGWTPGLWPTALPIDFLGEPLGVVLAATVVAGVCIALHRGRLALLTVLAQGAIWATIALVKPVFDRTIHGAHFAYPSGHTAGATAFALVIGLLVVGRRRLGRLAGLLVVYGVALAVGLVAAWAQTVLGAHYATDTFGGFCLALAVVPPLALLLDRLLDRLAAASATVSALVEAGSPPSTSPVSPRVTPPPSGATYRVCNQAEGDR